MRSPRRAGIPPPNPQARPPARPGLVTRVALVVVGLTSVLLAGCRDDDAAVTDPPATTAAPTSTIVLLDPNRPRTATGANGNPRDDRIGPPADHGPADPAVGEGACFDEFLITTGDVPLRQLAIHGCQEPHDAEVFAALDLAYDAVAVFPGETELGRLAAGQCLARFQPYVGREYATSRLRIAVLRPSGTTWASGDRRVVCSLYDQDLVPMTGSARASLR